MTGDRGRNWVTAEEAIRQKEELLRIDPEYRAQIEAAEAKRQAVVQALTEAEQPIVRDLNEAGVPVKSVWDPNDEFAPYSTSLPILMAHLEKGGYPDRVMEAIAHSLAVKPAIEYWDRIRDMYLRETSNAARGGLAATLAKIATKAQFDELVELVHDESLGESRILLIGDIVRVGREQGKDIVRALVDDPVLGKEATARARRWK